jgi:hypothetical protein
MFLEFLELRKSFQHLRFASFIALANSSPHSLALVCDSVFAAQQYISMIYKKKKRFSQPFP